jgi:hypothetical protein
MASKESTFDQYFYIDEISDFKFTKITYSLTPKKVIFNDPATIVYWEDGSKTVVKCGNGDVYDCEKGFAMCVLKRLYGDKFHSILKKHIPKEENGSMLSADKSYNVKKIKQYDFEIIFENHDDAERVLLELVKLIKTYGFVYVSDLYDIVNISNEYENTKYGWYDLTSASIKDTRDGYVLDLPLPIKHI